ncbi:uncharacterized protein LOC130543846 [Ursus arctos]|uniref:uncharacterized protein LOC130543846 n=1 Tax=Ursus arctos TaxID=9644 RepID=UPI0025470C86|nr:uncharacterized protein LOC130543846 [Ursus arctos]
MLRLREGTMERFVQSLVPSFPDGSISTTSTIFCMYEMFTSATQVLGQQFNRTLSPFLGTWPDQNLQAIYQSLGRDRVEIKVAYVHGAMVLKWHAWDLTNHVPLLLMQRELLALTEAEVEGKGDGKLGRLTGMRFMGWVFLSRPWGLSWFCKGIRKVSDVDEPFSVSCPSASSRAPSSGRARNRASYRARGDPGSVSTVTCGVRASLPSVSCSRTATRAPIFCMCAGC